MASIQKRGKDTYVLIVELGYDGRGKRIQKKKTVHVRTKKEAEAELRKWLAEIEAGTYVAPQKMTFEQFVKNEWIPKYAEKNLALTTRTKYVGQLRAHILPLLGGMRLESIKTLHLVTLLDDLQKDGARKDGRPGHLTGATLFDIYKILKSVFTHAVKWKAIPSNPMEGVDRPKVQKRPPGYYEEAEAVEVIQALQDEPPTWRLYFLAAMMGGFRRGELSALEWSDVDFERGTITVRRSLAKTVNGEPVVKGTKTDEAGRVVVMPSWYMDELRRFRLEWKKERMMMGDRWEGGDHEYIFHGGTGKPFYHSVPTQRWRKFLRKHNLRPIRLHDLRHTAATLLIEAGVDLKAVQERLGHSSYRVTADIYAHVTQKLAKETAEKLEKFAPDTLTNKSVTKR